MDSAMSGSSNEDGNAIAPPNVKSERDGMCQAERAELPHDRPADDD